MCGDAAQATIASGKEEWMRVGWETRRAFRMCTDDCTEGVIVLRLVLPFLRVCLRACVCVCASDAVCGDKYSA